MPFIDRDGSGGGGGATKYRTINVPMFDSGVALNQGVGAWFNVNNAGNSTTEDNSVASGLFHVPSDFSSIVAAYVVGFAWAASENGNVYAEYIAYHAGDGEGINTHAVSSGSRADAFTDKTYTFVDVSAIFASLAAGDVCGVQIYRHGTDPLDTAGSVQWVGLFIVYE